MKRFFIGLAMVAFTSISISGVNPTPNNGVSVEEFKGGSVKIVNDTKEDLQIHTGSGHVKLIHGGGSTSVSCEEGRKISHSNGSKATGLIFTIDNSMCGKTIKLSQYL
ncbi:MAG: hypothetical protein R2799_06630 [Crocinitomicaceae bacterium]|nr:hypothetical protein [Crocinitomicaceae bacterium]